MEEYANLLTSIARNSLLEKDADNVKRAITLKLSNASAMILFVFLTRSHLIRNSVSSALKNIPLTQNSNVLENSQDASTQREFVLNAENHSLLTKKMLNV